MMTLRYIFHSGFLLETARCILVFDYWMDPADVMSGYMNTCKHVYVFSSHFHEDHFTKAIFKWKKSSVISLPSTLSHSSCTALTSTRQRKANGAYQRLPC